MSRLLKSLLLILPSVPSQRDRDEAWVAQAADLHDVERRLQALDNRGRHNWSAVASGLYPR